MDGTMSENPTIAMWLEAVARQDFSLPPGVRIDLNLRVIDVLAAMASRGEPGRTPPRPRGRPDGEESPCVNFQM